jgi:phenylacetate-CoA ligase
MHLWKFAVRHLFYPAALWRRGETATLRYFRQFERTQFLSEDALRAIQLQRLRTLLRHAAQRCPFYAERLRAAGIDADGLRNLEDLRALPVLEKSDLQEHLPRMIARDWPQDDLIENQTGGSTGSPVRFYLSRDRKCSRAAATLRHNRWARWEIGDRAAVLWGAPTDRPAADWWAWLRASLLREPLWLDAGGITEEGLHGFHRDLWNYRPTILLAYARAAVLFARFVAASGLELPPLRSLVTSAEVLEDEERALLEQVFGCRVFNRYGCREVSVLASECTAHNGLHTMAEGLYLEIEGPRGPAAPGEKGSILVTDLLNQAMPLIRYRIGDLGSWAQGPCPCGRSLPRLAAIAGRVTDFLVGSDGRLVSGVYLATYVIAQRPSLGQVQVRQDRPGAVVYRIKPGRDFFAEEDLDYLQRATRRHLGDGAVVATELVEDLPAETSGKFLFSRSSVAPSFLAAAAGTGRPIMPGSGDGPSSLVADERDRN